jgi:hypothetical protein
MCSTLLNNSGVTCIVILDLETQEFMYCDKSITIGRRNADSTAAFRFLETIFDVLLPDCYEPKNRVETQEHATGGGSMEAQSGSTRGLRLIGQGRKPRCSNGGTAGC